MLSLLLLLLLLHCSVCEISTRPIQDPGSQSRALNDQAAKPAVDAFRGHDKQALGWQTHVLRHSSMAQGKGTSPGSFPAWAFSSRS